MNASDGMILGQSMHCRHSRELEGYQRGPEVRISRINAMTESLGSSLRKSGVQTTINIFHNVAKQVSGF